MKGLSEKLGARIRYFRMVARMSQGELANASQLTNGYLSDVERGKVNISITNLNQIAEALGVPLSVLLDCDTDVDKEQTLMSIHKKLKKMPDDGLLALQRIVFMLAQQCDSEEVQEPYSTDTKDKQS